MKSTRKIRIRQISNKDKSELLRPAKGMELIAGGVWYYKNAKGEFESVVSELKYKDSGYGAFCNNCSKMNFMYLNREFPNYSLTKENHIFDQERINRYKK